MFTKDNKYNNSEKISTTKRNFSLLFNNFCYYYNNGMNISEISKIIQLNWRTVKNMEKKYKLLEKIHSLKIEPAIEAGVITTLKDVELFEFLTKDNNYFKKYSEINQAIPISRYFYKSIKQYITDKIVDKN